jgi:hypothetical protein
MKQLLKISGMMLIAIAVFSCETEDVQPAEDDRLNIKLSTSVPDSAEKESNESTVSVE